MKNKKQYGRSYYKEQFGRSYYLFIPPAKKPKAEYDYKIRNEVLSKYHKGYSLGYIVSLIRSCTLIGEKEARQICETIILEEMRADKSGAVKA